MPTIWTEELEKCLLLVLLDVNVDISRKRFAEAAEVMGHGLTGESVRYVLLLSSHVPVFCVSTSILLAFVGMSLPQPSETDFIIPCILQSSSKTSQRLSPPSTPIAPTSTWSGMMPLSANCCCASLTMKQSRNGTP